MNHYTAEPPGELHSAHKWYEIDEPDINYLWPSVMLWNSSPLMFLVFSLSLHSNTCQWVRSNIHTHTHTHTNLYTDTCCALIWNKRNTADTQTSTQTKTRSIVYEWVTKWRETTTESSLSEALIHHEAPNQVQHQHPVSKRYSVFWCEKANVGVYSSPSSPRSAAVRHRFISNWWQLVKL